MKILHLMTKQKFTESVSRFYDKWFCDGSHSICYISPKNVKQYNPRLVIKQYEYHFDELRSPSFFRFLNRFDFIVLHSVFLSGSILLRFIVKRLVKRVVWIEWGYDLYDENKAKDIRGMTAHFINQCFKSSVNSCVCIFPPDKDVFKSKFPNSKAKLFYAPYCGSEVSNEYKHYSPHCRLQETISKNEPIYIQVGHQAGFGNQINHFRSLDSLARFKNQDIRIFLPLSYGDTARADAIEAYAKNIFGAEKVIVLKDFLPPEEYFELTRRVDIAVFEAERQLALGNINRLLFRNTKVFLSKGSIMYEYFSKRGVPVFGTDLLDSLSFEDLCKPVEFGQFPGHAVYINELQSFDWKLERWRQVYGSLKDTK